jgi:hypothetical protein
MHESMSEETNSTKNQQPSKQRMSQNTLSDRTPSALHKAGFNEEGEVFGKSVRFVLTFGHRTRVRRARWARVTGKVVAVYAPNDRLELSLSIQNGPGHHISKLSYHPTDGRWQVKPQKNPNGPKGAPLRGFVRMNVLNHQ